MSMKTFGKNLPDNLRHPDTKAKGARMFHTISTELILWMLLE